MSDLVSIHLGGHSYVTLSLCDFSDMTVFKWLVMANHTCLYNRAPLRRRGDPVFCVRFPTCPLDVLGVSAVCHLTSAPTQLQLYKYSPGLLLKSC